MDAPGRRDTARNLSSSLTSFVHLSRAEVPRELAVLGLVPPILMIASPSRTSIASTHVTIEGALDENDILFALSRRDRLWMSIEERNIGSTVGRTIQSVSIKTELCSAQIAVIIARCTGVLRSDSTNARSRKTALLTSS